MITTSLQCPQRAHQQKATDAAEHARAHDNNIGQTGPDDLRRTTNEAPEQALGGDPAEVPK
ncbi:hypothetical protein D8B26_005742 [Coccidioides posadasii str. Silveira]|uniref:uncharacterized protein n=1 Tax=Coccidioides posadasii (strain RMSCC 757 / Silveira) TaxID=443226 RepID=UPI001BEF3018|nr:hypothetical protein D8B26_005742 [Coccidioides posadasii str. Silveira]